MRPISRARFWGSAVLMLACTAALGLLLSAAVADWFGGWGVVVFLPVHIALGYTCGAAWGGYVHRLATGRWPDRRWYLDNLARAARFLFTRQHTNDRGISVRKDRPRE